MVPVFGDRRVSVAGTTTYAVGMPVFDRTEVDRPDGTTLVVEAPAVAADRIAPLVGNDTAGAYRFEHAAWLDAGVIRIESE